MERHSRLTWLQTANTCAARPGNDASRKPPHDEARQPRVVDGTRDDGTTRYRQYETVEGTFIAIGTIAAVGYAQTRRSGRSSSSASSAAEAGRRGRQDRRRELVGAQPRILLGLWHGQRLPRRKSPVDAEIAGAAYPSLSWLAPTHSEAADAIVVVDRSRRTWPMLIAKICRDKSRRLLPGL